MKQQESVWFNKSVFYAMLLLTTTSVITSCTLLTSKPIKVKTVTKEPVVLDIPNAKKRTIFACDHMGKFEEREMYVCDLME